MDTNQDNQGTNKKSTSETGHYKTVVEFNTIKVILEQMGTEYKPQKEILKLANVETKLTAAKEIQDIEMSQENTLSLAIDNRQNVYFEIKPFCTQIINLLSSTNVGTKTIQNAIAINAKIQGIRIGKKTNKTATTAGTATPTKLNTKTISVAQLSYDSIHKNFKALIDLLQQDGNYAPEDAQYTIVSLQAKADNMALANENTTKNTVELGKKRIARDKFFYTDKDSVIQIGKDIKKYIRGKYKLTSPEFAQVKNLKFTDLSKKKKPK